MRIMLNGEIIETSCITAYEARNSLCGNGDVIILNGFQISADRELKHNDVLTIIQKGKMPGKKELESMMAARHTPKVHDVVKRGRVAIAGLGGLGSNIAVMLARTGVGNLLLIDFDVVEPSNLNRQNYYISHLGLPKTVALQMIIKEINPFISVETQTIRVEESNVVRLFQDYGIVCEAFDGALAKAMLVNTLLEKCPGKKIVSGSGMAGFGSSNLIKTHKKMKDLYICGDLESEAAIGNGLMAPRVQICAGHQANMVLRLLLGIEEV